MKRVIYAAFAIAAMASCTKNDIESSAIADNAVRLSSQIAQTRVDGDSWDNDDPIAVSMFDSEGEALALSKLYRADSDGVTTTFTAKAGDEIYFPNSADVLVDIVAIYPQSIAIGGGESIDVDVATTTKDLMYGVRRDVRKTTAAVDMEFKRVFSQVSYSLTSDGSIPDDILDEAVVTLLDVKQEAEFDILSGSLDFTNSRVEDVEYTAGATGTEHVIPQVLTPTFELFLGNEYGYYKVECPEIELASNTKYNFSFEISLEEIKLKGSIADDWQGEEEEELTPDLTRGYTLKEIYDGAEPDGDFWTITDSDDMAFTDGSDNTAFEALRNNNEK